MPTADHPEYEEVNELLERIRNFTESIETSGFYIEDHEIVGGPFGPVALLDGVVGEVAMTPRVQSPDDDQADAIFAEVTQGLRVDMFLDERTRILREGL